MTDQEFLKEVKKRLKKNGWIDPKAIDDDFKAVRGHIILTLGEYLLSVYRQKGRRKALETLERIEDAFTGGFA